MHPGIVRGDVIPLPLGQGEELFAAPAVMVFSLIFCSHCFGCSHLVYRQPDGYAIKRKPAGRVRRANQVRENRRCISHISRLPVLQTPSQGAPPTITSGYPTDFTPGLVRRTGTGSPLVPQMFLAKTRTFDNHLGMFGRLPASTPVFTRLVWENYVRTFRWSWF